MIKANFDTYATYKTDSLYQWDLNQVLSVYGLNLATAPEVHFSNRNMDRAIVRQAQLLNNVVSVGIPNSLLQDPLPIYAHIGIYEGSTFKVVELVEVPVIPRKRPADYQIEDSDEEVHSFKALENALANKATNARVDTLIAHNNDTDGNTELLDVRYGAAGEVYDCAGDAVRSQLSEQREYVENLTAGVIKSYGKNILDWSYAVAGKSIDINTGVLVDSVGYYCIDKFMRIDPTKKHYIVTDINTRMYIYFYDSSKKYISSVYSQNDEELAAFPANSFYIKLVAIRNSDTDDVTTREIFLREGYKNVGSELILKNESVQREHCAFFVRNLLDQDAVEYNSVINPASGGISTNYADRAITDYIAVEHIKNITTNFDFYIAYYDAAGNFIADLADTTMHHAGVHVLPSHDELVYIRIVFVTEERELIESYYISNCEDVYTGEDVLQTSCIPVGLFKTWYKGKKITAFGDSITELNMWQPFVSSALGCEMINCGIGGTTVANNGQKVTVEGVTLNGWMAGDDRINLIPEDSDVILLFGGANDWGTDSIAMGELGDGALVDNTFKSAYSLMIKKIVNKFPRARIIAMTPINGRTSSATVNEDAQYSVRGLCLADFSDAIKEVCHYFGIPCIDVHGNSGINTFNRTTYIGDIVHPNKAGGKLIANEVINGLKRYEPIDFI